ncbi:two-component system, NtrC family, nitrogen regulation response regulator GlnG [Aliiroseovarius crassostreae]|uniref:DNA-binding transcriptional regulator NtrC n=1 Tax=Aliiroseovarius crassostreae TaxID=154981 RepID=A0A0P7J4B8_9RHOB|nr:response regulator [Aliiroseovarius crassostreae]KPN62506.1 chemotaxis protein CheY [Aliiroseovarius crassostreae]SFU82153.1 two-component system, NtrC family, nitrogen regulation response regulator GlnG [Aliiroseovarius crassostreae]
MDGTVLIADDDRTIRTVLTQALTRAGCRVHATGSMMTLLRWVEEGRGDVVISDVIMPDGNGLENLPKISEMRPDLPVIVISAQNTIMTAIQAAEAEAFDYLPKPFDLPDLMKRVGQALERKRLRAPASPVQGTSTTRSDLPLVGRSPAMQDLYRLVARVLNIDLPVLITGESGTGKSLIAQAIHDFSARSEAPFVVATPDDLRPADALSDLTRRVGGGTILFDGIGDLDGEAQARLSRFLDGLGASGNGGPRVIAISQGNLSERIRQGAFREDLYYRLAGVVISVPALRERLEDIPALAAHFIQRTAQDGILERRLSNDALEALRAHPWPGNLRQLENLMTRLLVTGGEEDISLTEITNALSGDLAVRSPSQAPDERLSASVARHLKHYFDLHGGTLPPPGLYQRILREIELPLLEIALDATSGNQAKCADLLGINRNTLRKKITDLGIEVTRRRKLM